MRCIGSLNVADALIGLANEKDFTRETPPALLMLRVTFRDLNRFPRHAADSAVSMSASSDSGDAASAIRDFRRMSA